MHSLIRITIVITCLLSALIGAPAQSASGNPTAGSSISGRVTSGGNPMPGLIVGAQRNDANAPVSSEPAAKATTDQDGRYQITGLAAGRYRVISLSTVYVVAGETQITPLSGKTITLNENDHADNLDFTVTRGAVITGKVIDAESRPLIGERVTLMSIDERGGKRPVPSLDFTMFEIDDRGVYRIFGLPAGRYVISAGQATDGTSFRTGFPGPTYRRTFHPNAVEEEQAKIIEVKEGQEAGNVDIAVGRPVKTFDAAGRIVNAETGQPMPNLLFAYGPLRAGASTPSGFGSGGSPTNVRGEFRLDGLLPGRYAAFLFNGLAFNMGDAGSEYYSDPVPFEITDGDVSGIEIRVHRASSITGVVVAEDGNDQALLSRLAQTFVNAQPMPGGPGAPPPMPMIASTQNMIQPDGSFRVAGVAPGKVRLMLLGSQGLQLVRVEREGSSSNDMTIQIAPGEHISGLRMVVTSGTGVVRGEVKLTGGDLPQGARLIVSARRINTTSSSVASAEVDTRGRFLLERLPPGEYELTARVMPTVSMTITMPRPGSGSGAGGTIPPPAPPPALPSVKQNVTVTNGTESQVTLTLDLSGKK